SEQAPIPRARKPQTIRQPSLFPRARERLGVYVAVMATWHERFHAEAGRVLIDRRRELDLALCCLLAGGNLLIEDTPGVGKTTMAKVLARVLGLEFRRIQFTNDLLPSDILGVRIFDASERRFVFHPGPIFAQFVLGDELNRASPRTQSAVLQAMDEKEVTVEGETHPLPQPFIFAGTQNPLDQTGTSKLPESQIDRFLMRLELGIPPRDTRKRLLERDSARDGVRPFDPGALEPVCSDVELARMQRDCARVHVSDRVQHYILDLTSAAALAGCPLSPRVEAALQRAAQAWGFLHGRGHVLPEDVQAVFAPVTLHRLAASAKLDGDSRAAAALAGELIEGVRVP
ncbi:MAG: AAA family ATPase, partial [Terrimicrobiaceae bacterium]|nr:AAA family ATPase [Terrimicrobiaceae bacterium]